MLKQLDWFSKVNIKIHLMNNIGKWIINHGDILLKTDCSNEYTEISVYTIKWRNRTYEIVKYDGDICSIDCLSR